MDDIRVLTKNARIKMPEEGFKEYDTYSDEQKLFVKNYLKNRTELMDKKVTGAW